DLLDRLTVRLQLRHVRGLQVLQIGHESVHFAQHLLNPLWPTPADARNPFELVSDLWVQLIPPVVPLLDEPLLLQLRQERIDRAGGWSPPTLGHLFDGVHDLRPVLRAASDQGERPHPQASLAVSSSNARSTSVTRNARWSSSSPLRYGVWNLEPGGYQFSSSRWGDPALCNSTQTPPWLIVPRREIFMPMTFR